MQIGNYLNTYNNMVSSGSEVNTKTPEGTKTVSSTVENLSSGSVFEGSVVAVKGNTVTLGLSNGGTISARLDGSINLSEGQSVFFEVKSNDGATIQIKPVSTELTGNPILTQALNAAGVQVNERSLTMVNSMMNEGMNINAENLLSMNRLLINNPSVDPKTIVLMNKLGLPVTAENADMFKAYAANEAQISNDINNLVDTLPSVLASGKMSAEESITLNDSLTRLLFTPEELETEGMGSEAAAVATGEEAMVAESEGTTGAITENITAEAQESEVSKAATALDPSIVPEGNIIEGNREAIEQVVDSNKAAAMEIIENDDIPANTLANSIDSKSINELAKELKSMNYDFKDSSVFNADGKLKDGVSARDVIKDINQFLNKPNPEAALSKESVHKLFSGSGYKNLLSAALKDNWSLNPKEMTEPEAVKKLYEKILSDAAKLSEIFDVGTKSAENVQKAVNELKDNVNFMNQVNELYNFVQLPIKLSNEVTNSELYVYNNKKSGGSDSDELTAFLHFDLEHLGSTDIYVKLKNTNVSCDWKLADEVSLKLIEDNIDILEERLKAKGYNCSMKVTADPEGIDFVEDFLKASEPSKSAEVHRYSFDVRT